MVKPSRRERRLLLRRGGRKDECTTYVDNKGIEYDYQWVARVSSFYNIFMGCWKNGFPVIVKWLPYPAWAFYPFFFIKKDVKVKDPIPMLNHERIHVRQQRDLHLIFSLPLIIIAFWKFWILGVVPFVPTIVYWLEMFVRFFQHPKYPFSKLRTCVSFELEAISRCANADYLFTRKFMAVLAYTGIKRFKNYGLK